MTSSDQTRLDAQLHRLHLHHIQATTKPWPPKPPSSTTHAMRNIVIGCLCGAMLLCAKQYRPAFRTVYDAVICGPKKRTSPTNPSNPPPPGLSSSTTAPTPLSPLITAIQIIQGVPHA